MSVKNDNKGFLREKLGDYRVDPPESVWRNISTRIGGGNRRAIILISLAAAATLALAITLGINYFGPDTPSDGSLTELQGEEKEAIRKDALSEGGEARDRLERQQEAAAPEIPEAAERREETAMRERVMAVLEEQRGQPGEEAPVIPEGGLTREGMALAEAVEGTIPDAADAGDQDTPPQGDEPRDEADIPLQGVQTQDETDPAPEQQAIRVEVAELEEVPVAEPLEISREIETDPSKWTLGAVISPLYSFRDAQAEALESGRDFESGMLAYAGGIQISYRAAGRLSIESGLLYNKMGVNIGAPGVNLLNRSADYDNFEGVYGTSSWVAVSNSVGNIISNSGDIYINEYKMNAVTPEAGSFQDNDVVEVTSAEDGIQQQLEYLELPFNVRYTVVDRALELQLIGGLSTNFLVNNSVTMDTPSGPEEIGYLSNIRNVNYSGNAGLGMIYHIHERFSLRLEPRFRYFLHSVNDETLPSTRPYSLGFYTGLNYTF